MRRSLLAVLVLTILTGCGQETPAPPRPEPTVALALHSPSDAAVVRAETVEIRGTVRPARAQVTVLDRRDELAQVRLHLLRSARRAVAPFVHVRNVDAGPDEPVACGAWTGPS